MFQDVYPSTEQLYRKIIPRDASIRKINITFNDVVEAASTYQQLDLFSDPEEQVKNKKIQDALLSIKKKYGKNAVLKGMNLQEGATTVERSKQIGGHRSGE